MENAPPVIFSVRLKWLLLLLGIVLSFSFSLYFIIRYPIETSFRNSFEKQFGQRTLEIQTAQTQSRESIANNVSAMLTNPRLIAAIEANDMEQFYYDLSKLAEPILQRQMEGILGPEPFVRFIDWEGFYQTPPDNVAMEFGIKSYLDESLLQDRLTQLSQFDADEVLTQSGFIEFPLSGVMNLFSVINIPLQDFYGDYWGDLLFVLPAKDAFSARLTDLQEITGTLTPHHYYSPEIRDDLESIVHKQTPNPDDIEDHFEITFNQTTYIGYLTSNTTPEGFDQTYELILFATSNQVLLLIAIQKTILYATVGFSILAIMISLFSVHRFTRPIEWLMEGTQAIRSEKFDHRIPIKTSDELGALSIAFNEMAGELEMKKRFRTLLDLVADPQVAEELTSGKNVVLGGEERVVSILFCDIRGFTPWSQRLEPKELVRRLNDHMTALTEVVHRHGGVIDKFVGDEIMALFGAPKDIANPAQSAYDCAIEMLHVAKNRYIEGSEISIGIGIATGPVVAGCMGSADRLNYTVIGKHVNLASRLCGKAPAGSCWIDKESFDALHSQDNLTQTETELKGFEKALTVYHYQIST